MHVLYRTTSKYAYQNPKDTIQRKPGEENLSKPQHVAIAMETSQSNCSTCTTSSRGCAFLRVPIPHRPDRPAKFQASPCFRKKPVLEELSAPPGVFMLSSAAIASLRGMGLACFFYCSAAGTAPRNVPVCATKAIVVAIWEATSNMRAANDA